MRSSARTSSQRKRILFSFFLLTAIIFAGFLIFGRFFFDNQNKYPQMMKLASPAFENNKEMPKAFTCRGEGRTPPLIISLVPEKTASLALTVDDLDASGSGFVHWVVWNIDPAISMVEEGLVPAGAVEGENSVGQTGFIAPCPPSDTHRYLFTLYALDRKLDLPSTSIKFDLNQEMSGHILDRAELIGTVRSEE